MEGLIFSTNNSGNCIIIDYKNYRKVTVKFVNTGYETETRMDHLKLGNVKDYLTPTVYRVGVLGKGFMKNETSTQSYIKWSNMLQRCYCEKYKAKMMFYKDCTTSENFKYYPYFKEWCNKQVGFNAMDDKGNIFTLDKDILFKGNKLYSEYTCCFVPTEINSLLTKSDKIRGEHPIGVYYHNRDKKYIAKCKTSNKTVHLGAYFTSTEAFIAYKQAKEDYIKEVANKWKDQIDPRVYEALMKYQVEITD